MSLQWSPGKSSLSKAGRLKSNVDIKCYKRGAHGSTRGANAQPTQRVGVYTSTRPVGVRKWRTNMLDPKRRVNPSVYKALVLQVSVKHRGAPFIRTGHPVRQMPHWGTTGIRIRRTDRGNGAFLLSIASIDQSFPSHALLPQGGKSPCDWASPHSGVPLNSTQPFGIVCMF